MPIENERKFLVDVRTLSLVDELPVIVSEPGVSYMAKEVAELEQFYVAYDTDRNYVSRCRRIKYKNSPEMYWHTTKIGRGENCHEIEIILNAEEYEEFREFFKIGNMITKTRYTIASFNDAYPKWELDVFHGDYEGLYVLEVEIYDPSVEVVLPDWAINPIEVTGDKRYNNSYMAVDGTKWAN